MSEEYHRLQEAVRDVEREIADLEQNHRVNSAAELAAIERQLDILAVQRSSLTKAMILLRSVNNPQFQQKQKEFVRQLPHKYHSQGTSPTTIDRKTPRLLRRSLNAECIRRSCC